MSLRQQSNPLTVRAGDTNRRLPTAHCSPPPRAALTPNRAALTIVEMLVAMTITLLIMAAVVTVFANVSNSVTRRRATIEMSSALRNVRETLARDLAGATCPAVPWQRPESNVGYLEIIEGPQNDYYPSIHLFDGDGDGLPDPISDATPGIDLTLSSLPGSNLGGTSANDFTGHGTSIGSNVPIGPGSSTATENIPTDGRGLGDGDDILMLTVRNEDEPFVGRIPRRVGSSNTPSTAPLNLSVWEIEEVESTLAEVVWFAVENPVDTNRTFAFGEPGFRTIHRRALLILPDLNYAIPITGSGRTELSGPGVVRVLNVARNNVRSALAALVAFQDRFDLSVRLEWDPLLPGPSEPGRWVLKANTLGDLTKRENRYEHHGYVHLPSDGFWTQQRGNQAKYADRFFPFAALTAGIHSNSNATNLQFVPDPDPALSFEQPTGFRTFKTPAGATSRVVAYEHESGSSNGRFDFRPFVHTTDASDFPATVRAILDETGRVVHLTKGLAPLGGTRRGEDVMLTNALAFDLRVYDPGAPIYSYFSTGVADRPAEVLVQPGDPAWVAAYYNDTLNNPVGDGLPALSPTGNRFVFETQGAFVDLGYGSSFQDPTTGVLTNRFRRLTGLQDRWAASMTLGRVNSPFFSDGGIRTGTGPNAPLADTLTTLVSVYDTWSWHYENNGINEDGDDTIGNLLTAPATNGQAAIDEGANGLDDRTVYYVDTNNDGVPDTASIDTLYGPDDYAERETRPPYDAALRGIQVSLRAYERDSRQIREVRVKESFVPE